ncbi:MAG: hypothetical protein M0042_05255 [Nitrospiraceae bacterium]|nr:hypothetical protein [Nitrospiraceae bacterium]
MQSEPLRSFEYKNDFLYILIREEPSPGAYLYFCGINLSRFCRLAWRKGGICSNPAVRGIQLLRAHVSAFAAEQGMIATKVDGVDLPPLAPHGHGWYNQDPLRLEQASAGGIREIIEFSVMDLARTVLAVCVPDVRLPKAFPDAAAMQQFLESLSVVEERERVMAFERENGRAG